MTTKHCIWKVHTLEILDLKRILFNNSVLKNMANFKVFSLEFDHKSPEVNVCTTVILTK